MIGDNNNETDFGNVPAQVLHLGDRQDWPGVTNKVGTIEPELVDVRTE